MKSLENLIAEHRAAYDRLIAAIDDDWTSAEYERAEAAEDAATVALLRHVCRSLAELRVKIAYITAAPNLGTDMQPEHLAALLPSLVMRAAA